MRCRSCGYSLWGITTGRCPECDAPFRVEDFRFRPRAVAFTCPECRTSYAGTSAMGLLEPPTFDCVGCRRPLTVDAMIVTPAPGMSEAETMASPNPWIDRERIGLVKAYFKSVLAILIDPVQFMRSIVDQNPGPGTVGAAVRFAAWTAAVFGLFASGILAIFLAIAFAMAPPGNRASVALVVLSLPVLTCMAIGIGVILFPLFQALLAQLGLVVAGVRGARLGRTSQVLLYVGAAGAVAALPIALIPFGGVVLFVWQIVIATLMLREAHRTTTLRACVGSLFSHLLPVMAAIAVATLLIVASVGAVRAQNAAMLAQARAAAAAAAAPQPAVSQVSACGLMLSQIADSYDDQGRWPKSPLHAVVEGTVEPVMLIAALGADPTADGAVGAASFRQMLARDVPAMLAEGEAIVVARGDALAPFAIGSLVFTYPLGTGDADDWLGILLPDGPDGAYHVFTQVREQTFATRTDLEAARAAHNEDRARRSVPAIPDPHEVEHVSVLKLD